MMLMMFPFMSLYLHMLQLEQDRERRRRHPWDTPPEDDFNGFGSREARRRALGSGLLQFGSQVLGSASTGDFTGGLARGASAFGETLASERERNRVQMMQDREELRRQAAEERANEQEQREAESHGLDMETGRERLSIAQEERQRTADIRARSGKSAEQMAADIRGLAAAHPDNLKLQVMAQRAAGYAVGDDDDVDKLTDLHDKMTDEAFWQDDFNRETTAGIGRRQAEIDAGVVANPKAAERRADEELEISRGHLAVSRENAGTRRTDRNREMSLLQSFDRIQEISDQKYDEKIQRHAVAARGAAPTEAQKSEWRREALQEAQAEYRQILQSTYQYTADGQLVPVR